MIFAENPLWLWVQQKIFWGATPAPRCLLPQKNTGVDSKREVGELTLSWVENGYVLYLKCK